LKLQLLGIFQSLAAGAQAHRGLGPIAIKHHSPKEACEVSHEGHGPDDGGRGHRNLQGVPEIVLPRTHGIDRAAHHLTTWGEHGPIWTDIPGSSWVAPRNFRIISVNLGVATENTKNGNGMLLHFLPISHIQPVSWRSL